MSKIIISCDEGYIIILSLYLQLIGSSVPGDVSNQSTLSFDDYKKKKEEERRSKFKKATVHAKRPRAPQKSSANDVAKVQVGLVTGTADSSHLKKVKGRTIPVLLNTNSDAATLLKTAVEKHSRHFKQFNKNVDYVVLYADMSVVQTLPGSSTPFTLEKYKSDLLKPYSKLHFWLCIKEEFENANCGTSDSDDDDLCSPSFEVHCRPTASTPGLSLDTTVSQSPSSTNSGSTLALTSCKPSATCTNSTPVAFHQCPTCFELFSQREIECHADACAEAWVDPIGDPDQEVETPSEEELACYLADATSTLRESAEANLETVRNTVSSLRSLCQCELTNRLSIRRRLIFQDYMDARKKKWFKPKALLKVTFIGEPAVDDGGPRREFFTGTCTCSFSGRKD